MLGVCSHCQSSQTLYKHKGTWLLCCHYSEGELCQGCCEVPEAITKDTENPNCDGGFCKTPAGEVRRYILNDAEAAFLCQDCWANENQYRAMRVAYGACPKDFQQQSWDDAKS